MAAYDKSDLERRMAGAVEALKSDLAGLRTGRASTALRGRAQGSTAPTSSAATSAGLSHTVETPSSGISRRTG